MTETFYTTKTLTATGARKLGEWLSFCLREGWPKSALDGLQRVWVENHDEHGNLLGRTTEPTVVRN